MSKYNKGKNIQVERYSYYVYTFPELEYIHYEVIENTEEYSIYIYHDKYGIKLFCMGLPHDTFSAFDVLEYMKNNIGFDSLKLYEKIVEME